MPSRLRRGDDVAKDRERLVDRHVDVALGEAFRSGGEYGDRIGAGRARALVALQVRDQYRIPDARRLAMRANTSAASASWGSPLGCTNDVASIQRQARLRKQVDERTFVVVETSACSFCSPSRAPISNSVTARASSCRRAFRLRACRAPLRMPPQLFEFDERGAGGDNCPSFTRSVFTEADVGASMRCSIFMASNTTKSARSSTASPPLTAILTIFPGIGAVTCASLAAPRGPQPSRQQFVLPLAVPGSITCSCLFPDTIMRWAWVLAALAGEVRDVAVLHICYPFQIGDFVGSSTRYIRTFQPQAHNRQ